MVAKNHRLALLLALGVAMSCPAPARAWTEFLSMDVLPGDVGWIANCDHGTSPIQGGIMTLTTPSYCDFISPASWSNTADPATGYTIEFRMAAPQVNGYPGGNVGFMHGDWFQTSILFIDSDRLYVGGGASNPPPVDFDATNWHTYRIVVLDSHHQIYVDDVLTFDWFVTTGQAGSGNRTIAFGDLDIRAPSQSQWDYVAYETHAVVPVAPTTWGRLKTLYRGAP